MRKLSIRWMN